MVVGGTKILDEGSGGGVNADGSGEGVTNGDGENDDGTGPGARAGEEEEREWRRGTEARRRFRSLKRLAGANAGEGVINGVGTKDGGEERCLDDARARGSESVGCGGTTGDGAEKVDTLSVICDALIVMSVSVCRKDIGGESVVVEGSICSFLGGTWEDWEELDSSWSAPGGGGVRKSRDILQFSSA